MLLPTKGISEERALLTVGAVVLDCLASPASVSGLWERLERARARQGNEERITFDWFALTLSALFAIGAIDVSAAGQLRRADVSA